MVHLFALRLIHPFPFRGRPLQLLVSAASQSCDLFQIAEHWLDGMVGGLDLGLSLSFQKQLRLFENALPDLR